MDGFFADTTGLAPPRAHAGRGLMMLLGLHIVACCLSLIFVTEYYPTYNVIWFDKTGLYAAVPTVALFGLVALLFVRCRFSFGWFLGFYFYTMVAGYLWLAPFSKFQYDHVLAGVSAFASALAFLMPALFITSPIKQRFVLSATALDHVLSGILVLAVAVVACGAYYNFRLVGLTEIYDFREQLQFPTWLGYAMAGTTNALLPFALACFVSREDRWRAGLVLVLLLLFYPITLSKLALFAPFWLIFLMLLFRLSGAKTSVVLSLFLPLMGGLLLVLLLKLKLFPTTLFGHYFSTVNLRMMAFPSIAMDVYNDYFAHHSVTHFCQINLVKRLIDCPATEPLPILMLNAYHVGNLNASLFATEGIASVGVVLAPISVFVCGLVIALANRLSAGLPPRFILLSAGILPQTLLNVPLTIGLVTHGAAALFLLWYVTPRTMFEQPNK